MKSFLPVICLSFAASAFAGTVVTPYVTDAEIRTGEYSAAPATLSASEAVDDATNALAYLVWSDPGGGVRPVTDPYALHRRRVWRIAPPDWYADPDAGVNVSPSNNYQLIHAEPAGTTRSVTVRPADGWTVLRVDYTVTENRTADVTAPISAQATETLNADGSCTITGHVMDGVGGIAWLSVRIDTIYAERKADVDFRDDLTLGDYYFRDAIGDTSLGKMRQWVVGLTTNRLAQFWARYPAERAVDLAGQNLYLDRARTSYIVATNNSARLYVGGFLAISAERAGGGSGADFSIIGMKEQGGLFVLYVPAGYDSYFVQTCTDLLDAAWETCPATREDTTYTYPDDHPDASKAGTTVSAVALAVTPTGSMRFWRVVASDGEDGSVLVQPPLAAPNGVLLKSPNGTWWKLTVTDAGALVPVQADAPNNE